MKTCAAFASALMILLVPAARAGDVENCHLAGTAVNDALRAEAFRVAFDERLEALGIAFYSLPKTLQPKVLADIDALKPTAEKSARALMEKVPEWNRQKMDGLRLAREVLTKAYSSETNAGYALHCLKALN